MSPEQLKLHDRSYLIDFKDYRGGYLQSPFRGVFLGAKRGDGFGFGIRGVQMNYSNLPSVDPEMRPFIHRSQSGTNQDILSPSLNFVEGAMTAAAMRLRSPDQLGMDYDFVSNRAYNKSCDAAIKFHIKRLSKVPDIEGLSDAAVKFKYQVEQRISEAFKFAQIDDVNTTQVFDPVGLWRTLLPDTNKFTQNTFGILPGVFPHIYQALSFQDVPQHYRKYYGRNANQMYLPFKYALRLLETENRKDPVSVLEIVDTAVRMMAGLKTSDFEILNKLGIDDSLDYPEEISRLSGIKFDFPQLIGQALQLVKMVNTDFRNGDNRILDLESAIISKAVPSTLFTPNEILIQAANIQKDLKENAQSAYRRKEKKKEVDRLIASSEVLVRPEDHGLKINENMTGFLREKMQDEYEGKGIATEQIFFIDPTELASNPTGFYEYQQALISKIADKLGLTDQLPPFPHGLKAEYVQDFIDIVDMLREKNDHIYLLLHPEVQKAFFALMPFSVAPPLHFYSLISSYYLPWQTPVANIEYCEVVNPLKNLQTVNVNRNWQYSVRGGYIGAICDAGAEPLLVHGSLRAILNGNGIKHGDTDIMSLHNIAYGGIMRRYIKKFARYEGYVENGRSMKGVVYPTLENLKTEKIEMQVLGAWMGRAPRQKSDLLILSILGLSRFRSTSCLLQNFEIDRRKGIFGKVLDPLGGILDLREKRIDYFSPEDAFPRKSPMAIWLAARTWADITWMGASYGDYDQLRKIIFGIISDWSETRESLADIQFEDLDAEVNRCLTKAMNADPFVALCMMGDEDRVYQFESRENIKEVGIGKFFPNINLFIGNKNIKARLMNAVMTMKREFEESGLEFLVRVIEGDDDLSNIYQQNNPDKLPMEEWLKQTMFGEL